MSFNGSGQFLVNSAGQPVVASTLIEASVFNAFTADVATGLSTCITKNGQTTLTANIPFGGFKATGLAAGSTAGDSVRYEQATSAVAITGGTISGVPITVNAQNAGYTLVLTDSGKAILMSTAGTFTIPANSSVAFGIGTAITFVNGTTSCTIPITTDTMTLAGTSTTGTRTLAANGIATAIKTTSTTWIISGMGLT